MPNRKNRTTPQTEPAASVGFISLGCAKNLVDSQIMAGVLHSEHITLAPSPEEADIIIVNTCAFIEEAREESIETVLSACSLKDTGPCRAVIVTGCLPQRYKQDLRQSLPEVDAFIGLDELEMIGDVVLALETGRRGIFEVSGRAAKLFEPKMPGIIFTGGPYAYLKVAEGCNHRCAFCAIPMIRGKYRSRSVKMILKEAEELLSRGVRELNLISQDVTSYGKDLGNEIDLCRLLRELGKIGGEFWIRLLYGHPSRVTDKLLEVMAGIPQVCHYLDLPIQHSHPEILRAMGRAGTIRHVCNMAEHIRAALPGAVLRTTCLVGFPGERDEHFEHLLDFAGQARFDHLGVFTFSPEEHTKAFDMPDRPAPEIAGERRKRLLLAQKEIIDEKAAGLIGVETEIMLERSHAGKKNIVIGRPRRLAPEVDGSVFVEGASEEEIGNFIRVKYTAQVDYDMKAELVQAPR